MGGLLEKYLFIYIKEKSFCMQQDAISRVKLFLLSQDKTENHIEQYV